jgi:hypothetical protein
VTLNPFALLLALLPAPVAAAVTALADKLRALLQGETLRAIVYGAAIVVWLVTHIAEAMNIGNLQVVNLDTALAVATGAAALLTELARRYVYSPATVAQIVATPPTAAGPINAAAAAGVEPALIGEALVTAPDPVVDQPDVVADDPTTIADGGDAGMTAWVLPPLVTEHEPGPDDDCVFCAGIMQVLARWPGRCPHTLTEAEAIRAAAGIPAGPSSTTDLIRGITVRYGATYAPTSVKGWPAAWAALTPGHSGTISGIPANAPAGSPIRRWVGAYPNGHRIAGFRLDSTARLWIMDPEGPADGSYKGEWCSEADLALFAKDPNRTHSIQSMLVAVPADPSAYVHTVTIAASLGLNVHATPHQSGTSLGHLASAAKVKTNKLLVHGEGYLVGSTKHTDWLGTIYAGKQGWIKRGWTKLVA